METGDDLADVLERVKFSCMEWTHDHEGLFYNVCMICAVVPENLIYHKSQLLLPLIVNILPMLPVIQIPCINIHLMLGPNTGFDMAYRLKTTKLGQK